MQAWSINACLALTNMLITALPPGSLGVLPGVVASASCLLVLDSASKPLLPTPFTSASTRQLGQQGQGGKLGGEGRREEGEQLLSRPLSVWARGNNVAGSSNSAWEAMQWLESVGGGPGALDWGLGMQSAGMLQELLQLGMGHGTPAHARHFHHRMDPHAQPRCGAKIGLGT